MLKYKISLIKKKRKFSYEIKFAELYNKSMTASSVIDKLEPSRVYWGRGRGRGKGEM